jgi:regulatory protein
MGSDPLELAYRFLGDRDRTTAEVRRHLRRRGVGEDSVEDVVQELTEQGSLDDERYARRFGDDRRNLDGWGSERIEQRLRAVGIPEDVCERVLDPLRGQDLEAALALLERRLRRPPADDGARQRALGLLVRRGYELELAYEAVRRFERERGQAA